MLYTIYKIMPKFIGKFEYIIDGQGRVSIPYRFRKLLLPEANETFLVAQGPMNALWIFPLNEWRAFETVLEKLGNTTMAVRQRRRILDTCSEIKLDKQGRITLLKEHLSYADITRDVVIVGDLDKLILWDKVAYERILATEEQQKTFDQAWDEFMTGKGRDSLDVV